VTEAFDLASKTHEEAALLFQLFFAAPHLHLSFQISLSFRRRRNRLLAFDVARVERALLPAAVDVNPAFDLCSDSVKTRQEPHGFHPKRFVIPTKEEPAVRA
jgi:hypothetical protein